MITNDSLNLEYDCLHKAFIYKRKIIFLGPGPLPFFRRGPWAPGPMVFFGGPMGPQADCRRKIKIAAEPQLFFVKLILGLPILKFEYCFTSEIFLLYFFNAYDLNKRFL